MYIPMVSEFFKSLFSNSEKWEQEQKAKLIQEIVELTDGQEIDMNSPDVDIEILEDN